MAYSGPQDLPWRGWVPTCVTRNVPRIRTDAAFPEHALSQQARDGDPDLDEELDDPPDEPATQAPRLLGLDHLLWRAHQLLKEGHRLDIVGLGSEPEGFAYGEGLDGPWSDAGLRCKGRETCGRQVLTHGHQIVGGASAPPTPGTVGRVLPPVGPGAPGYCCSPHSVGPRPPF